jgi:hypothetical protein
VKAAQDRFPRAQIRGGKTIEVLSTLSQNNLRADARAFAELMRHTRELDRTHRVIMVQVENEVGVLGEARDRSPAANEAFAKAVPRELMDHLEKHKRDLLPEFKQVWDAAGSKTSGTWEEVFGKGAKADEIFMGWNYARHLNAVAEAGKKKYAIPMFVNAWIVQPKDKGPGDYPSGGPQDHMHDIWRAGAPQIDLLCPDIYLPDFTAIAARYSRSGNPLFVPESASDTRGAANAFFAIGQQRAIGYSPFGIDNISQLMRSGPDAPGPPPTTDLEGLVELNRALDLPLHVGEFLFSISDFAEYIRRGALDVARLIADNVGGISGSMRVGMLADAFNLECTPHNWGNPTDLAVHFHLELAMPNAYWFEMPHPVTAADRPYQENFRIDKEGYVLAPTEPGLGYPINRDALDKIMKRIDR